MAPALTKRSFTPLSRPAAWSVLQILFSIASTLLIAGGAMAQSCSVRSGATAAPVVELYTSEGCSSCPPADKWVSTLKSDPSVVALAFHVDYWDRLGWKDRFSSALYTQRQAQTQSSSGARFNYTPQVLVDGADRMDWSRIRTLDAQREPAAKVDIRVTRENNRYVATVTPAAGAPTQLAAYWALTENDHQSAVKAGENEGVTLHHDFVVREYRAVAAWPANAPVSLSFEPSLARDPAHPASVNLVVVDAAKGRPLQAVKLGC